MSTNGAYLIKNSGRRYFYYCNKKTKLQGQKEGRYLRTQNPKIKYVVLKGRKYGWNVYITKY